MAQKTVSSLFNNFVSSLQKKPTGTNASFYPTPTGNTPVPFRNDRQANNTYSTVPSNAGATSTKPTTITTPTKYTPFVPDPTPQNQTQLPPAGKTFVQNLNQPNGTSQTPSSSTTQTTTPTSNPTPIPTPTAPPKQESPYLAYLKSMFDPEQVKTAYNKSTEANQNLANIQNEEEKAKYTARREKEQLLDRSGTGVGANARAANESIRRNSPGLADFSLRESAAARTAGVYKDTYDTMINAGKSVYEAESAATKAEQDQANKDRELGQTDTQLAQSAEKVKADQALAEKKFDEDKRQFGLNYALDARKVAIEQQKANQTDPNSTATTAKNATDAASGINLINSLLGNTALSDITGTIEQFRPTLLLGAKGNLAKNQYDQVKGMLSLENRSKLKGQGAVSDFEGRVLESAASSLGRNLSNSDFIKQLKQIRGSIATSHGLTADVLITDPVSKQSQVVNSDSARIAKAVQDGLIIEYQ